MKELAAHLSAVVYSGSKCSLGQRSTRYWFRAHGFFLSRDVFLRALLCLLLPLADQRITSGSQRGNTQRVPAIPSDSQRIMILQRIPADPNGSQSANPADLQRICSGFAADFGPSGSQRISADLSESAANV